MARYSSLLLVAVLAGCASAPLIGNTRYKYPMQSAIGAPAAEGEVEAMLTDNGNTSLEVEVKHLAPPSRIRPRAVVYVVWVKPTTGNRTPQNVGYLTVDKDLEGKLRTTTPYRQFQVLVTPESTAAPIGPTHRPVLSASVSSG